MLTTADRGRVAAFLRSPLLPRAESDVAVDVRTKMFSTNSVPNRVGINAVAYAMKKFVLLCWYSVLEVVRFHILQVNTQCHVQQTEQEMLRVLLKARFRYLVDDGDDVQHNRIVGKILRDEPIHLQIGTHNWQEIFDQVGLRSLTDWIEFLCHSSLVLTTCCFLKRGAAEVIGDLSPQQPDQESPRAGLPPAE